MPTPEFVLALRKKVGHDPLNFTGVAAVVLDEQQRVLLVQRADNHRWTLVSGMPEPGEQPAAAAIREVEEETGVSIAVERLVSVAANPLSTMVNGDQVWWTSIGFRCRYLSGEARVNDDESIDVRWCALDDLPALPSHHAQILELALSGNPEAWFSE